jgi:hypothetical protein
MKRPQGFTKQGVRDLDFKQSRDQTKRVISIDELRFIGAAPPCEHAEVETHNVYDYDECGAEYRRVGIFCVYCGEEM